MTTEDKELLIKDICARLPYGLKAKYYDPEAERTTWDEINDIYNSTSYNHTEVGIGQYGLNVVEVKPYLFPISSITKDIEDEIYQETGLYDIFEYDQIHIEDGVNFVDICKLFEILNKHHIDYRGLIPKNLALDATGLNIY